MGVICHSRRPEGAKDIRFLFGVLPKNHSFKKASHVIIASRKIAVGKQPHGNTKLSKEN
jgi:hypothetical protein